MSSTDLTRIGVALLLVGTLVGGVVLGGVVLGDDRGGPSPTPWASGAPGASALPADLPDADVDGQDLVRLPRYPGSVRTDFNVSADGRFRLTATEYLAAATLDEVRAFYRGVFAEHGWQRADVGYAGGEWTYLLVDGAVEALVELELEHGLIEIDLQISEPIETPTPRQTVPPTTAPTPVPPSPVPPPADDDDDDGPGGDDDDSAGDDGSDG